MRKLVIAISIIIVLSIIGLGIVFCLGENQAWWWQKLKLKFLEDESTKSDLKQAEDKVRQLINQRLEERAEELSEKSQALIEEKRTMEIEFNRITRDREDLLEKLKDYTAQRERLDARIRTLEVGIINVNEIKNKLAEKNKDLSEKVTKLEKEAGPVKKVKKKYEEKLADIKKRQDAVLAENIDKGTKKYRKEIDELDAAVEELREERKDYLENNKLLKKELNSAMRELSKSKAYLEKLKKEVAVMHYNLGVIFDEAGSYSKAMREYKHALKVNPDVADAHYNLGILYDSYKKDRDKAIYHYKMYLKIRPNAEDASKVKEWITERELEGKIWEKQER
jgi:tetratricopeptide (TPR) repeat protein